MSPSAVGYKKHSSSTEKRRKNHSRGEIPEGERTSVDKTRETDTFGRIFVCPELCAAVNDHANKLPQTMILTPLVCGSCGLSR